MTFLLNIFISKYLLQVFSHVLDVCDDGVIIGPDLFTTLAIIMTLILFIISFRLINCIMIYHISPIKVHSGDISCTIVNSINKIGHLLLCLPQFLLLHNLSSLVNLLINLIKFAYSLHLLIL